MWMIFTKEWVKAALIRAAKTFAQAAVGMIPAAAMLSGVDWLTVIGTAALAAVISVFTSFAGLPEVDGAIYGFWKAAGFRALKTVFQTAISMIPAAISIIEVQWLTVASTSLLAGLVSFLMSVANISVPEKSVCAEDSGKVVTVKAYEHYDENGDPISEEKCNRNGGQGEGGDGE